MSLCDALDKLAIHASSTLLDFFSLRWVPWICLVAPLTNRSAKLQSSPCSLRGGVDMKISLDGYLQRWYSELCLDYWQRSTSKTNLS